jgi:hypothetical protein
LGLSVSALFLDVNLLRSALDAIVWADHPAARIMSIRIWIMMVWVFGRHERVAGIEAIAVLVVLLQSVELRSVALPVNERRSMRNSGKGWCAMIDRCA